MDSSRLRQPPRHVHASKASARQQRNDNSIQHQLLRAYPRRRRRHNKLLLLLLQPTLEKHLHEKEQLLEAPICAIIMKLSTSRITCIYLYSCYSFKTAPLTSDTRMSQFIPLVFGTCIINSLKTTISKRI